MAMDQLTQGEVEALINELETKMARLRAIYEQYFMGLERMPPTTIRKDVVRLIYRLENVYVRNTATKFKIRSLIQRFNSYKAYWNRVERQIEEGTYVRDIRRAERNRDRRRDRSARRGERGDEEADDGVVELDFEDIAEVGDLQAELEKMDAEGAFDRPASSVTSEQRKQQKLAEIAGQLGIEQPKTGSQERPVTNAGSGSDNVSPGGTRPASSVSDRRQKLADIKKRFEERTGKRAAPTSRSTGSRGAVSRGGSDDDARRVFDQLMEAKRRCKEPTSGLTYENVAKSMKKQRDQLQKQRGATDVDFKVVIKDGRAFLKPEPK